MRQEVMIQVPSGIKTAKRFKPYPIRFIAVAFPLIALSFIGCGKAKPGQLPVYPVSGEVTFNGVPLEGASLTLIPIDAVSGEEARKYPFACGGLTDDSGEFVLTTYRPDDGAPEGEYAVIVSCENRERRIGRGEYAELLPLNYQSPTESKLTATITKGVNKLPTFELTGEARQRPAQTVSRIR